MEKFEKNASKLVKASYIKQGLENLRTRENLFNVLVEQRKIPADGLSDNVITYFIDILSAMDSNNFHSNCGVGEREGRVYSQLVSRRHFALAHGIGRSGDLAEVQPKAAGSSLLYTLTNALAHHALQLAGLNRMAKTLVVPLATGMSVALCLLTFAAQSTPSQPSATNPNPSHAKYVIWPRIDQKSCFKAIITAGLVPLVVENLVDAEDGTMTTNLPEIERLLQVHGQEVVAILSTTSCFAPRQPDQVDKIAQLCKQYNVRHVINNAYGLQCQQISKLINRACLLGRVDAVVQSTDKNFLVPVGGAVITSPSATVIEEVSKQYPGRASSAPILDLFITLLSMGVSGYQQLLSSRSRLFEEMQSKLQTMAARYGEALLASPGNKISIGVSLRRLDTAETPSHSNVPTSSSAAKDNPALKDTSKKPDPTYFGAMLFQRHVSGCRVVAKSSKETVINGYRFLNWGAHCNDPPCSYFTAASAMGIEDADVEMFLQKLDKCFSKIYSSSSSSSSLSSVPLEQKADASLVTSIIEDNEIGCDEVGEQGSISGRIVNTLSNHPEAAREMEEEQTVVGLTSDEISDPK